MKINIDFYIFSEHLFRLQRRVERERERTSAGARRPYVMAAPDPAGKGRAGCERRVCAASKVSLGAPEDESGLSGASGRTGELWKFNQLGHLRVRSSLAGSSTQASSGLAGRTCAPRQTCERESSRVRAPVACCAREVARPPAAPRPLLAWLRLALTFALPGRAASPGAVKVEKSTPTRLAKPLSSAKLNQQARSQQSRSL